MFHICLLSCAITATAAKMTPFIVGGNEASIKDWPFIVFMQMTRGHRTASCGGSLLSSQTVLTAAHCVDDFTKKKRKKVTFNIFMGHSSFSKATMMRTGLDYQSHKDYSPTDSTVQNDIAILFLSKPVKFGPKIRKTVLQPRFSDAADNKVAVAGWGKTDIYGRRISKKLKAVFLKSSLSKKCKKWDGLICIKFSDEYPYTGDSGGPMVNAKTLQQIGIVSFRDMSTGVIAFTSVPYYWDWIERNQLKLFIKFCVGKRS
ncbi:chymotrypsin-1-like [Leguminivora glycinivorella]|uniref:chymotrypsin-1-like n=1 Tax=Leguminivora glycinivorella TaxID=1035111 RepID=UPI00200D39FC|nr:chymotrypsin-1-like [Leguminivora glycinivorella]